MKKFICFFIPFLLLGCGNRKLLNTPTKKVEMFFSAYQSLDDNVLEQLNDTVNEEVAFNTEQRKIYIDLMKKHYQELKYDIKDAIEDGDLAMVTVEIEVTDYSKVMDEASEYLEDNVEEFNNESGEYDPKLFTTYRLEKLKDVKDRVKYTLEVNLTKIDDEWTVDDISESDQMKIHGLYNY